MHPAINGTHRKALYCGVLIAWRWSAARVPTRRTTRHFRSESGRGRHGTMEMSMTALRAFRVVASRVFDREVFERHLRPVDLPGSLPANYFGRAAFSRSFSWSGYQNRRWQLSHALSIASFADPKSSFFFPSAALTAPCAACRNFVARLFQAARSFATRRPLRPQSRFFIRAKDLCQAPFPRSVSMRRGHVDHFRRETVH